MAIREIPKQFEHRCDVCGKSETTPNNGRPKHWSQLAIYRDAYDFQGAAVADGTIQQTMCDRCSGEIVAAINTTAKSLAKIGSKP